VSTKKEYENGLSQSVIDKLEVGNSFIRDNNYEAALAYYEGLLNDMEIPRETILTQLGIINFNSGDVVKAETLFLQALGENNLYSEANFNLGVLFQQIGENQKALSCYKEALMVIGDDAEIYERMGDCCLSLNNKTDALSFFDAALRMRPSSINAAANLAQINLDNGKTDKALNVLQIGLVNNPDVTEFSIAMGTIYKQLKEFERALAHFRKVVLIDDKNFEGYKQLGECCFELGLYKQALPFYASAYKLVPAVEVLLQMGKIYEKQNQKPKAVQMYEKWLETEKLQIVGQNEEAQEQFDRINKYLAKYYLSIGDMQKEAEFSDNLLLISSNKQDESYAVEMDGGFTSLQLD
jgi:protein O-GlcNAc transferase